VVLPPYPATACCDPSRVVFQDIIGVYAMGSMRLFIYSRGYRSRGGFTISLIVRSNGTIGRNERSKHDNKYNVKNKSRH
ncbi:hypothetical protein NL518_28505, partial [Klebsiella pneumoniae]|nr:hypothetical protein [Klebsiella pneumoniae]